MKNYIFLAVLFAGVFCNSLCKAQSGNIYTFAGNGTAGFAGDGGPATAAELNSPSDVFEDGAGNFYIADKGNNRIRKINTSGIITTIVGTGVAGYTGDGGSALAATLHSPNRVVVDGAGNIYIADESNNVIRMVSAATGNIYTIVGTGVSGFSGDGGPATAAKLSAPTGVAVDLTGNIFISDHGNNRIRKVNTAGIISTYAGGGGAGFTTDGVSALSIDLCGQNYVSVDNAGTIYITNYACWHFLKVTTADLIYNVAGDEEPSFSGDCGPADSADILFPFGICPDNLGNVYLCPQGNIRVRKVNTLNYITTVAGDGTAGYTGDGGPAVDAEVSSTIYGIYADMLGNIYFADERNNVIRNFTSSLYTDTVRLCVGGSVTLSDTTGGGVWTSGNTVVATIGSVSGFVTGLSSGSSNITYTNTACPELFLVSVNNIPAITGDSVCAGGSITLTDSTSGGTWSSGNTVVAIVGSGTGIVTGVTSGIATISYVLDGGCMATTIVTVDPGPPPITGNIPLCPTTDITLSDATSGGTWSSGSPGIATVGSLSGSVTGVSSGTATISYYIGQCAAMVVVTINPLPNAGVIEGPSSLCIGSAITLSDIMAGGVWSSSAAGIASVGTSGIVTGVSAGTAIISYSVTNECGTAQATLNITVSPVDTTHIINDTAVCVATGSVTLNAVAGYTSYIWSTGSAASSILVTASGSYINFATTGCNTIAQAFNIIFNPIPVIALGNDTTFCFGDSLTLSSVQPPGSAYLWNTGSTATTITISTSGTYWLQITNSSGCVATDTIDIIVTPIPVVSLGPADTAVCVGDAITLQSSVVYASGVTYLWSNGNTTSSIVAYATGSYWLQISNGDCSGSDTINVTFVYDTLRLYNNDTAICAGQSVHVFAAGSPAISYQWTPTAGISISNILDPIITPDTSATYIITGVYPSCPDIVDSFHINMQPTPAIYLGGNRSVCNYDTVHITASVTPAWYTGYIYSWSPATDLDNTTTATVVFTAGDTSNIILTVTTPAHCTSVDSLEIIVHTDSFVHYDTTFTLCPGDSVQLQPLSDDPGTTYSWQPAMYMTDVTSSAPWVFPLTTQSYWAVATSSFGCHDTVDANIVVLPGAALYLGDSVTLYPGQSYQLNPQTNCTSFLWFPPAGLSDAYISDPVANPVISTRYIVYGTTEWGCKTEDSICIYVDPNSLLALPNAFAPGSGPDNLFKIIVNGEATLNYFRVYNRWGNLVYSTTNINDGWDGTFNGQPQPFDVYVYEVEAVTSTGAVFRKAGNVTLLR